MWLWVAAKSGRLDSPIVGKCPSTLPLTKSCWVKPVSQLIKTKAKRLCQITPNYSQLCSHLERIVNLAALTSSCPLRWRMDPPIWSTSSQTWRFPSLLCRQTTWISRKFLSILAKQLSSELKIKKRWLANGGSSTQRPRSKRPMPLQTQTRRRKLSSSRSGLFKGLCCLANAPPLTLCSHLTLTSPLLKSLCLSSRKTKSNSYSMLKAKALTTQSNLCPKQSS